MFLQCWLNSALLSPFTQNFIHDSHLLDIRRFLSSTLTAGMQLWIHTLRSSYSPALSPCPYRKGLGTKLCTQPFRLGIHYCMHTVKHLGYFMIVSVAISVTDIQGVLPKSGLLHDCLSCNQCDRYPRSATKEFFEGPLRSFFFIVNQYLISEDLFGWHFYHNYATKELLQGGRGTDRFKRRSFSTTLQIEVMTHHISRILSVFSQKWN